MPLSLVVVAKETAGNEALNVATLPHPWARRNLSGKLGCTAYKAESTCLSCSEAAWQLHLELGGWGVRGGRPTAGQGHFAALEPTIWSSVYGHNQ